MVKLYWSWQTLNQGFVWHGIKYPHSHTSIHRTSMLKGSHESKEFTVQFCTVRGEKLVLSKAAAGSGCMPCTLIQMLGSYYHKAAGADDPPPWCFHIVRSKMWICSLALLLPRTGDTWRAQMLNAVSVKLPKCLKVWATFTTCLASLYDWFVSMFQCCLLYWASHGASLEVLTCLSLLLSYSCFNHSPTNYNSDFMVMMGSI